MTARNRNKATAPRPTANRPEAKKHVAPEAKTPATAALAEKETTTSPEDNKAELDANKEATKAATSKGKDKTPSNPADIAKIEELTKELAIVKSILSHYKTRTEIEETIEDLKRLNS